MNYNAGQFDIAVIGAGHPGDPRSGAARMRRTRVLQEAKPRRKAEFSSAAQERAQGGTRGPGGVQGTGDNGAP